MTPTPDNELQFYKDALSVSSGQLESLRRRFLLDQTGASSGAVSGYSGELWKKFFEAQGITVDSVDDAWKTFLEGQGYSGTVPDMRNQYFADGFGYETLANYFDTSTWLTRGGFMTGLSQGKQLTIAANVLLTTDTEIRYIITTSASSVYLRFTSGGALQFRATNDSSTVLVNEFSTGTFDSTDGWLAVLVSVDLEAGTLQMYVNDVDVSPVSPSITDDDMWLDRSNWSVGALPNGNNPITSYMSDLWMDDTFIDFSVQSNRRKFFDANNKPVSLDTNGQLPTGSSPVVYLQGDSTDYLTNKGTGGGWTENGTVVDVPNSPTAPFDQDVQNYINAVLATGATIPSADQIKINTFVTALKNNNLWDSITEMGLFRFVDSLSGAVVTLKGGTLTNVAFVEGDYNSSTGLVGNGSTKYLTSSTNAQTALTNNDTHIAIYTDDVSLNSDEIELGCSNGSNQFLMAINTDITGGNGLRSHMYGSNPAGGELVVGELAEAGLMLASRTASNDHRLFVNGSQVGSTQTTSEGNLPNADIWIFNFNNSPSFPTSRRLQFYSFGSGLTPAEVSTYNTLVEALLE